MPSVSGKIHFTQCHFQVHLWYLPSIQLIEEIIDHALCLYLFDSVFVICVCSELLWIDSCVFI